MASDEREPLYISTAIPYVNARPHVGFAFEIVLTDAIARYQRARGRDVFFLTGTDDNSLKNVEAAEERGIPIETLVEENAARFFSLKDALDLSFDDFLRTSSDPRHRSAVEKLWNACAETGDIYEAVYTGLYCVGCEQFYTEDELIDGLCPEGHPRPPELVNEHNYFFRLSRYQDALLELIETDRLRILPATRKAEITSFIRSGLEDLSISRARERSRGWGLPVPGDESQVIYVWFDALTNYISALDFGTDGDDYLRYWVDNPDRTHVIGKGILRFHAAYWPAMLLSAGVPLPSTILVHGYLTSEGRKISKSLGAAADPTELSERYGPDALRYYFLSQFRPGEDGDFSEEQLVVVKDHDLADQLGNLLSRVIAMIDRYAGSEVPSAGPQGESDLKLAESAKSLVQDVDEAFDSFEINAAVARVWDLVREANKYVVEQEPWRLAKEESPESSERVATILYNLAEVLRIVAAFSAPFIPKAAERIATQLGLQVGWQTISDDTTTWGATKPGTQVETAEPLFPKSAT